MNRGFETFFARNMYRRVRDCWNRPIGSTPGAYTDVVDRVSDDYNWTFRCVHSLSVCVSLNVIYITSTYYIIIYMYMCYVGMG